MSSRKLEVLVSVGSISQKLVGSLISGSIMHFSLNSVYFFWALFSVDVILSAKFYACYLKLMNEVILFLSLSCSSCDIYII